MTSSDQGRAAGNPFPRIAVAISPVKDLPNYFTESQAAAVEMVQEFADRFASRTRSEGLTIGIRGTVGSGKTHTVFQLQNRLSQLLPSLKHIYAKTLNAQTILGFYTGVFAGSILLEDFKNLASQHFFKLLKGRTQPVGAESGSDATILDIAADQATINLREGDQQYLLKLIQADLIPAADLKAEMERDINSSEELLLGDLALAYSKLLDPKYGQFAVQWLQGKLLSEQRMRDIGVRSRIATIPDAQHAFKFLLDAYRRADVPLMVCIDEFERSVLTDKGEPDVTGRNLLKDIAEAIVLSGHLFVISGYREAWESLTPDFFGRVSKSDVCDMTLTDPEAEEVIHTWERDQPSAFSDTALSVLSDVAEHNPRRLLEVAHHSWEMWSDSSASKISPEQVRQATRRVLGDSRRTQDALSAISQIAEASGVIAGPSSRLSEYDRVLGTEDAPLAFVKVTASVFKGDEIDNIRSLIEARRRAIKAYPNASTCTVIAGYSSPPIVEELRRSGDMVLRFDESQFSDAFRGFLVAAKEKVAQPVLRSDSDEDQRYATLLSKFDVLAEQNRAQVDELRRSFASAQQQKEHQLEQRFAKSSGEKLTDLLEELTSLLAQENELLFNGEDGAAELRGVYEEQRSRVHYAQFLDRVMPESHIAEYLWRYVRALDDAAAVAASLGPAAETQSHILRDQLRATYAHRLDALRDMRQATTDQRPLIHMVRSIVTTRNVLGVLGVVCIAAYVAVLVASFTGDSRVVAAYSQDLERLRAFSAQYQYWPTGTIPAGEFNTILTSFMKSLADVRSTAFSMLAPPSSAGPGGEQTEFDQALSAVGSAIACAQLSLNRPKDCDSAIPPRYFAILASEAETRRALTQDASFGHFLRVYVGRTAWWAVLSSLPLIVFAQWRWLRRLLPRQRFA